MNPQDPLANLHPLRQPELIGWWPPAPGWWLLLIAVVLALVVLTLALRRHRSKKAYRRQALLQLQSLQLVYQSSADAGAYLSQINALLKSVALRAYPRDDIAAVHGAPWRAFLNSSLPQALQLHSTFDDAAYQTSCSGVDLVQLENAAQHWIKHHRGAP